MKETDKQTIKFNQSIKSVCFFNWANQFYNVLRDLV